MIITEVGVNVTMKVDLGYRPYMAYLEELKHEPNPRDRVPAFGTRENTVKEISLWSKAQVEDGEDPEACAKQLAEQVRILVAQQFEAQGVPVKAPDDMVYVSTQVTESIATVEDF